MDSSRCGDSKRWIVLLSAAVILSSVGAAHAAIAEPGDFLISSYTEGYVRLFDGTTGEDKGLFVSGVYHLDGIAFLSDGSFAALAPYETFVRRYDGRDGTYLGPLCQGDLHNPRKVIQGPDEIVWVTNNDGHHSLIGFDPNSGQEVVRLNESWDGTFVPVDIAFIGDRMFVAARHYYYAMSRIQVFDTVSHGYLGLLGGTVGDGWTIKNLLVAPDGALVVARAQYGGPSELTRVDPRTGEILATSEPSDWNIDLVAMGLDGNVRIVGGSEFVTVDSLTLDVIDSVPKGASVPVAQHMAICPVPEPATLGLVAVGLLAMFVRRGRWRDRQELLRGGRQGVWPCCATYRTENRRMNRFCAHDIALVIAGGERYPDTGLRCQTGGITEGRWQA